MNDFKRLLNEVTGHLKYLSDNDVDYLDINSNTIDEVNPASGLKNLEELREEIGDCQRCRLCQTRTNIVFGEGPANAELVFVGEGPGYDEDKSGRPFVGRAGQLLDKIISAMGLTRNDIYICNIVKCRPPQNRDPEPVEIETCGRFLNKQLDIIKPKIILALGRISGRYLVNRPNASIRSMRGSFYTYQGIDLRVTYHPAALLRDRTYRRPLWEDVQAVMKHIGRPIVT